MVGRVSGGEKHHAKVVTITLKSYKVLSYLITGATQPHNSVHIEVETIVVGWGSRLLVLVGHGHCAETLDTGDTSDRRKRHRRCQARQEEESHD
jgi:hypothetical protein